MVTTRKQTKAAEPHGYEFGGPIGAFILSSCLPPLCYLIGFVCNDVTGCPAPSTLHPKSFTLKAFKQEVNWPGVSGLLNVESAVAVALYYSLSFILYALLPAQEVDGTELASGGRLKYRMNAFSSAIVTLGALAIGTFIYGPHFPVWPFIWRNYIQLLTANIIISYALAIFVYVRSFEVPMAGKSNPENRELAAGGHSGNLIYDWFIGRELNPPIQIPLIGHVDIKSFMELRPGLLGWIVLDLAFAARQYANYGAITSSMAITVISQSLYVLDGLYMEPAILTTIDITTDGFGFMLSFGDLVWVPFIYSLQARYLAIHPVELGVSGSLAVLSVLGLGYYIFRSANNQKNRFRTNPEDPAVKHLEFIQTKTGSKLLTTGWWGRARHINYMGDWVMSWAYCLPTGIAGYVIRRSGPFRDYAHSGGYMIHDNSIRGGIEVIPGEAKGWGMLITYFYMIYFAVLLVHRERRDEEKCRRKYGKDWEEYCRKVRWRIIPGIY